MSKFRELGFAAALVTALAAPVMAGAMRRANRKDLARIKAILEASDLTR